MTSKQTEYVPRNNYFNWYYCGVTDIHYSQSPCNDCVHLQDREYCGDNPKRVKLMLTVQSYFEMPKEQNDL